MEYTILVNSCDNYSDTWFPFFTLLKKYWPGNIPPVVLNTETKDFSMDGIEIRCPHCPNNPHGYYGKRLKYALSQIRTKYVLCLLDDFFIRERVQTDIIEQVIEYMNSNDNISCFNFDNVHNGRRSEKYKGFVSLPQIAEYKLNMQAAVWRKDDLTSLWKERVNPWTWETVSNKLTYFSKKEYYFLEKGIKMPVHYGKKDGLTWGIVRGKWVREDVVPFFKNEGITINFENRGYFVIENYHQAPTRNLWKKNMELLYILGMRYTVANFVYSGIYRRIRVVFGLDAKDYDSYLAEKYNLNGA